MPPFSVNSVRRFLSGSSAVRRTKLAVEQALGVHLLKELPHGTEQMLDIQRLLPNFRCEIVFDVGANLGQTARTVKHWYPHARVHCFEPSAGNFRMLTANTTELAGVTCWNCALGAASGTAQLEVGSGVHTMFHLADSPSAAAESVKVEPLDTFVEREQISRVSYLKIDTEGHDLQVLYGGSASLAGQRIDLVEVEAGMNPSNERHVPLERLKGFLEASGYLLLGVYEKRHEWPTRSPVLRRCNALFISRSVVADNTLTK